MGCSQVDLSGSTRWGGDWRDGERSEKEKGEGKCGGRQFRFRAAAKGEGESRLGGERSGDLEKGGRGAKKNTRALADDRRLTPPKPKKSTK